MKEFEVICWAVMKTGFIACLIMFSLLVITRWDPLYRLLHLAFWPMMGSGLCLAIMHHMGWREW